MALKAKLEKLEGVNEVVAKEYKEIDEDGKKVFVLDIEGQEDVGALKRAKEHEKKARQDAEKQVKELLDRSEKVQEELDEIRRGAIPKGDVEKLEGSWKEKLTKLQTEMTGQLDAAYGTLQRLLVDNVAQSVAQKISNAPDLILPHVKARLKAEKTNDGYVTRVLDAEGKATALTVEELQKELTQDKRFAPIIIGSKASGGGASGGSGSGSASGSGAPPAVDPKFDWGKATPKQIAEQLKAKKAAAQGG